MSLRRIAALVVLVTALLPTALAWADGDPASDVLLGDNVFYPYLPAASQRLQRTLNAATKSAQTHHFHIKVALIDSPSDLGVVPEFFGQPQTYAKFLDQELRLFLGPHPPLLVVMPAGYGVEGLPPAATRVAATLAKPDGTTTNDLAKSAIVAVEKLSAAAGHPLGKPFAAAGDASSSGAGPWAIVLLAATAVLAAGAVIGLRMRRSRRPS